MQRIDTLTGELLSAPSLSYQLWANDLSERLPEGSRKSYRAYSPGLGTDSPKTPTCHTGSFVTLEDVPQPAKGVLVDWLAVSFHEDSDLEPALDRAFRLFGGDYDWSVQDRGGHGYECSARRGNVTVYWGGAYTRGTVYVVATGQGCRQLEAERIVPLEGDGWRTFLRRAVEWGGRARRLDVALDDVAGHLDLALIASSLADGDCVTRAKKWDPRSPRRIGSGTASLGDTVYLGQRSSKAMVRFYDKRSEVLQKHKKVSPDMLPAHWVRAELQLNGEHAELGVAAYLDRGVDALVESFRGVVDFTDPAARSDSRRSRRPLASWWEAFVRGVDRVRLWSAPKLPTMESTFVALENQFGPALAILVAMPRGVERLAGIIQSGGERIGRRHLAMLHGMRGRPMSGAVAV